MSDKAHTTSEIAHLEMVQSTIGRMAANCTRIKALAVTVVAAGVAVVEGVAGPVVGMSSNRVILIALAVPLTVFWVLDAYYLRLERSYRALFDAVRRRSGVEPFSMDISSFRRDVPRLIETAFSTPILWMYPTLVVFLILLEVILGKL